MRTPPAENDAVGNLLNRKFWETEAKSQLNSITIHEYDVLNRMTNWSEGSKVEANTFAGAEWHRVATTTNGVTTSYIYDGDNVVGDLVDGDFVKLYVSVGLDQETAKGWP